MPQVGKKHFEYGTEGEEAAEKEANRTGKRVIRKTVKRENAWTTYNNMAQVFLGETRIAKDSPTQSGSKA